MFSVTELPAVLGAQILGLDLSVPLTDASASKVREALHDHQVIVIPEQTLRPEQFVQFSRHFGKAVPHVLSQLRHRDFPEILPLSNTFKDGQPTGVYDGAAYWHTDMSYEDPPGSATLVYSISAPKVGGETRFANMFAAYEALGDSMKRRVDDLVVLHHYGNRQDLEESSPTSAFPLTEEQKESVQNVYHPLVRPHPATGRKALYGVSGSSFGIVGIPDDEAIALLDELKVHATRDDFVYQHHYTVGEVVVWDNYSTLHSATLIPPATKPSDTRLLYRISVKDVVVV